MLSLLAKLNITRFFMLYITWLALTMCLMHYILSVLSFNDLLQYSIGVQEATIPNTCNQCSEETRTIIIRTSVIVKIKGMLPALTSPRTQSRIWDSSHFVAAEVPCTLTKEWAEQPLMFPMRDPPPAKREKSSWSSRFVFLWYSRGTFLLLIWNTVPDISALPEF